MRTVKEMRDDIAALVTKRGDLKARATAASRDLDAQELKLIREINDEIETTEALIKEEERSQAIDARLDKPVNAPAAANDNGGSQSRSGRSPITPGADDHKRFASWGEQLQAVRAASQQGARVDERLLEIQYRANGMSEGVPSDGGFLVQEDFSAELLADTFKTAKLAPLCRRIQISGNANSMKINGVDETSRVAGSRWGGVRGYWKSEAAAATKSKPSFREINLSLNKLMALAYTTDELLLDAAAMGGVIRQAFVSEFGFLMDDAIINGTGTGQPLGILNAGCLISQAKTSGQAADTITYANIVNMFSRQFADSRPNAVWLINQDCEPQLYQMTLAISTAGGQAVYLPPGGASAHPYSTLMGRPVIPIEQCATLGDLGDILLCDFSGYILAEKGGIKSDMSIHVAFTTDESCFRFTLRLDGQPVRASALTPYKGSNTLGHFVALAERA